MSFGEMIIWCAGLVILALLVANIVVCLLCHHLLFCCFSVKVRLLFILGNLLGHLVPEVVRCLSLGVALVGLSIGRQAWLHLGECDSETRTLRTHRVPTISSLLLYNTTLLRCLLVWKGERLDCCAIANWDPLLIILFKASYVATIWVFTNCGPSTLVLMTVLQSGLLVLLVQRKVSLWAIPCDCSMILTCPLTWDSWSVERI